MGAGELIAQDSASKPAASEAAAANVRPEDAIRQLGLGTEKQAQVLKALSDYQKQMNDFKESSKEKAAALQKKMEEDKQSPNAQVRQDAGKAWDNFWRSSPNAEKRDRMLAQQLTLEQYIQYRELVHPTQPIVIETFSDSKIDVLSLGIENTAQKLQGLTGEPQAWRTTIVDGFVDATRTLSTEELTVFLGGTKRQESKRPPGSLTTGQMKRITGQLKNLQQELVKAETTAKRREVIGRMMPELTRGQLADFKVVIAEEIANAKR